MIHFKTMVSVVALFSASFLFAEEKKEAVPIPYAHAHNDYEHKRPLLDALDHGFCSVEADVFLIDGKLLVGHNRWFLKSEQTLQSLYLDPLRERIHKNGGRVYPQVPTILLLIEIKSKADETYAVFTQGFGRLRRHSDGV